MINFDPLSSSATMSQRAQNAYRLALVLLVATVATIPVCLGSALLLGAWQLYAFTATTFVLALAIGLSVWLSRRDRATASAWVMIVAILEMNIVGSSLFADIGLVMGLVGVFLASAIAIQTMSQRGVNLALLISVIVGVAVGLVDLRGVGSQLVLPVLQTFAPAAGFAIVLIFALLGIRQFRVLSLPMKLIVAFLAVSLVPLGVLAFLNNQATQEALTDDANRVLSAAASQTAASLDIFFLSNQASVSAEAQLPAFVELLSIPASQRAGSAVEREVTDILAVLSHRNPASISSYALLDARGVNVADTVAADIGTDESGQAYFKSPLRTRQAFASSVEFRPEQEVPVLYFSSPVRAKTGEIIGMLRVRYDASILQQMVWQNNDLAGEGSFAVVFDENAIHLAHGTVPTVNYKIVAPSDPILIDQLQGRGRLRAGVGTADLIVELPLLKRGLENASKEPFFTAKDVAGGKTVNQVAVVPMTSQTWQVAFFQPREIFLTPARAQTQNTLLLAVVISGVVAAMAVGFGQLLAGPITRLTVIAKQVASGALDVRVPVESLDETGQLADAFNTMTVQLEQLFGSLEEQVQMRTAELILAMQVGQQAATIRDIDRLVPAITDFIGEHFNLYCVQVFLVDDLGRNLVLKSATGRVGQTLLEGHHSLAIDDGSLIGRVAVSGQSILIEDTAGSDLYQTDPLLPETRSELAIPLVVEERVLGILDVRANQPGTFTPRNQAVYEVMATQLATAIDSVHQLNLARIARRKADAAVRQLTRETWREELASIRPDQRLGYSYDQSTVVPLSGDVPLPVDKSRPESRASGREAEVVDGHRRLTAALSVQNQPIGRLSVVSAGDRVWSADDRALLQAVAERLAHKAENLRLFEEIQQQATREQLTRQITEKMRHTPDVDTIIETGLQELAKALSVSRTYVKLTPRIEPFERPADPGAAADDDRAG
jgi:GAF domain-containing protein/HAMP domain-containing protein